MLDRHNNFYSITILRLRDQKSPNLCYVFRKEGKKMNEHGKKKNWNEKKREKKIKNKIKPLKDMFLMRNWKWF